jgi:sensor histidine kinase YesM
MTPKGFKYTLIFGFWIFIGLVFGLQLYLVSIRQGHNCGFFQTVFLVLPTFILWSFYTLIIFWICRKYPLTNNKVKIRLFFIHIPIAFGIGLIHFTLMSIFFKLIIISEPDKSIGNYFTNLAIGRSVYQLVIYFGVLIACEALRIYEKYRQEHITYIELEKALVQTRLDALKAQLHPHFLFNTLNTISMLVRQKDEQTATNILAKLGDLLRYVLENREVHWVELKKEIDFVEKYLSIESIRFQNRLKYSISVDPSTENILIPDLLLQPIVENALKHGLSDSTKGGMISIKTVRNDDYIEISISDNGVGFNPQINAKKSSGIGIKNIEERIHNLYPDEASFKITSAPNEGTEVHFVLPVKSQLVYETA